MKKKIRVGIIFGGKSAEHEVALQSAKNIISAIDRKKYDVFLIGIDKVGKWHLYEGAKYLLFENDPKQIALDLQQTRHVISVPEQGETQLIAVENGQYQATLDVIFPVLHGTYGEDGTIQGLLKLMDIPFVGAGVLGSAVGMDKDFAKRLMRDANLPISEFLVFQRHQINQIHFHEIKETLGLPFFIKPANAGSSVGIHKISAESDFKPAVQDAFKYDLKILFEEFIQGREIECSVLGNDEPLVSVPGEVIPQHEFYSYEAKYIDEQGAVLEIPAKLSPSKIVEVQELAKNVFLTLGCQGMARVDVFFTPEGRFVVNEINTIPGFTKISMYPKLWEASGLNYVDLIDRLIQLALERHSAENNVKYQI